MLAKDARQRLRAREYALGIPVSIDPLVDSERLAQQECYYCPHVGLEYEPYVSMNGVDGYAYLGVCPECGEATCF